MSDKPQVQIEQEYLYALLNRYILSLEGIQIEDDLGGSLAVIPKEDLTEAVVKLLNEYGKERIKELKESLSETDNKESEPLSSNDKEA